MYKMYFGASEGILYCNRYFGGVNSFFVLIEELIEKNIVLNQSLHKPLDNCLISFLNS